MFLDPRQRRFAVGVWIASFSAGGALGPLVGGLLLENFWWGSVFLLNVPVMALLLALGPILLPEFRDPNAGRLDLPSAALSLAAVLGALGIAILGSMMTAVYRRQMNAAIPEGLPAEAESARDTLGAAAAVAADLADQTGATLLEFARVAFTDAVILTSATSACLAIVAAVVVSTTLRDVR